MSRTISARSPRRAGTFRPQLELLEDRLAPVPFSGTSPPPGLDPGGPGGAGGAGALLAFLAGFLPSAPSAVRTTSPVVDFTDPTIVQGASTLTRTDHSVRIQLTTSGLAPGVYTFWWVVINPTGTNPNAGRATARIVGPSGQVNVTAILFEGQTLQGHPLFSGGSLQDAQAAEIRMVVRNHGPVDPGRILQQLFTFEPDLATDVQRTIHLPPAR